MQRVQYDVYLRVVVILRGGCSTCLLTHMYQRNVYQALRYNAEEETQGELPFGNKSSMRWLWSIKAAVYRLGLLPSAMVMHELNTFITKIFFILFDRVHLRLKLNG